jgi:DNA-binding transcriptional ArsR family regulator
MASDYIDLAACFKALGHPTRLKILDLLRQGEVCVCHLEAALDQRQAYVSQQLMLLREAHLVEARKDGMRVYYRLTCDLVADLLAVALGDPVLVSVQGCPCPNCSDEK